MKPAKKLNLDWIDRAKKLLMTDYLKDGSHARSID